MDARLHSLRGSDKAESNEARQCGWDYDWRLLIEEAREAMEVRNIHTKQYSLKEALVSCAH